MALGSRGHSVSRWHLPGGTNQFLRACAGGLAAGLVIIVVSIAAHTAFAGLPRSALLYHEAHLAPDTPASSLRLPTKPTRGIAPMQDDVLIVGAGPTGLVLALWLTRLGRRVRIIDKTAEPGTTSRALALHARTLELYRQLDLTDAVIARATRGMALNMWVQGERKARVPLGAIGKGITPYPYVYVFPQGEHEQLLVERLRALGVSVERRCELVEFSDDGTEISARIRTGQGDEAEDQGHQRDHDRFLDQRAPERSDGLVDQARSVVGWNDANALRQGALDISKLRFDSIDHPKRVLAKSHHDDSADDFALAVELRDTPSQIWSELNLRDVTNPHRSALGVGAK